MTVFSTPLGETIWEYAHRLGAQGTATAKDLEDFQEATKRVHALLKDGRWHSATEIYEVTKQRDGMRRLRELRQLGYVIERSRPDESSREWHYRMVGGAGNNG